MKYGDLPINLGVFDIDCTEMMFYQYLPVKLAYDDVVIYESRLNCFRDIIDCCEIDFITNFSYDEWFSSYVYVTAKHMWQEGTNSYNRRGWHSDGFMTNDINYIWSDCNPTVFNTSQFKLTQNDSLSLWEMDRDADSKNNITFKDKSLLRLNQFNIHKVGEYAGGKMRTFLKISVSKDKYDLLGNSINPHLPTGWKLRPRNIERNIPQNVTV